MSARDDTPRMRVVYDAHRDNIQDYNERAGPEIHDNLRRFMDTHSPDAPSPPGAQTFTFIYATRCHGPVIPVSVQAVLTGAELFAAARATGTLRTRDQKILNDVMERLLLQGLNEADIGQHTDLGRDLARHATAAAVARINRNAAPAAAAAAGGGENTAFFDSESSDDGGSGVGVGVGVGGSGGFDYGDESDDDYSVPLKDLAPPGMMLPQRAQRRVPPRVLPRPLPAARTAAPAQLGNYQYDSFARGSSAAAWPAAAAAPAPVPVPITRDDTYDSDDLFASSPEDDTRAAAPAAPAPAPAAQIVDDTYDSDDLFASSPEDGARPAAPPLQQPIYTALGDASGAQLAAAFRGIMTAGTPAAAAATGSDDADTIVSAGDSGNDDDADTIIDTDAASDSSIDDDSDDDAWRRVNNASAGGSLGQQLGNQARTPYSYDANFGAGAGSY